MSHYRRAFALLRHLDNYTNNNNNNNNKINLTSQQQFETLTGATTASGADFINKSLPSGIFSVNE
jgi:hypothetical protein